MGDDEPGYCDVLIIGAGISGVGAAYRIGQELPDVSYTILERRARIGGTWDLFRYPGIRSDSDIFTLSYPFEPWTRPENMADGADIQQYLVATARKNGIDDHIRFDTHVRSANWDSATDTWLVCAEQAGTPTYYRARFLFFGTGYYDYDEPHRPTFPGMENFGGEIVHPQFWPESLRYSDKNVVVIGSGATAISMIPRLAETAAHVTMLQRSPTYIMSMPRVNPVLHLLRKLLPRRHGHRLARFVFAALTTVSYALARTAPKSFAKLVRFTALRHLPTGYDVDTHFTPRYKPWDQRLCLMLDADLYRGIGRGRVDVVTDHVASIDAAGIVLRSGRRLDADVIVTATGLRLQALGGVSLSRDGVEFRPTERFVYKGYLLQDVPNLAWCIGYTNASWTLRADMTARAVARLLAFMRQHGYTRAHPHAGDRLMQEKPLFDLQAGYIQRSPGALPRSATQRPWSVRHNYLQDLVRHRFDKIEQSMVFGRTAAAVAPGLSRLP